jgi:uncharacterized protein with PQ loop repeat
VPCEPDESVDDAEREDRNAQREEKPGDEKAADDSRDATPQASPRLGPHESSSRPARERCRLKVGGAHLFALPNAASRFARSKRPEWGVHTEFCGFAAISSSSLLNQARAPGFLARMMTELIGWAAAAILVATIGRQVYAQWRAGTTAGVSKWLFIGQVSASTGFVVYSWLERDWVFVATNAVMLGTAILGQCVYLRNSRKNRCGASPREAKNPYSVRG